MAMEEKCLNCGGTLFEKVLLDDKGHLAMSADSALELETDGVDHFYRCPSCSAKNVVIDSESRSGLLELRISHVKTD
jgi:DNA-directed RNA polymerase subunit RPC12/RpoP